MTTKKKISYVILFDGKLGKKLNETFIQVCDKLQQRSFTKLIGELNKIHEKNKISSSQG